MSGRKGLTPAEWLGLGTHAEDYRYAADSRFGVVAESRRPDHWVPTTCGYCSVGCGMLIGVRDGAAVAVRGDPDHPVNQGRLCPKGLSEHHTLAAAGRLTQPLCRANRTLPFAPATWDDALGRLVDGFAALVAAHGPDSVAILSTGQLVTEEFYALGKLAR
ncbi:MAG TPA: molybdopterin-dependent oxidoreductase, partial [Acidimicrobiales bacterium]|nr:molybdopterin-dependent oxidoreductase [Acidimicrobiales bacterium]